MSDEPSGAGEHRAPGVAALPSGPCHPPREAVLSPQPGTRRTPGLRREEVAQLAGVSVDYYVRLERGRNLNASEAVLAALARALCLDEAERDHLFAVARPARTRRRPISLQQVRPGVRFVVVDLDAEDVVTGSVSG